MTKYCTSQLEMVTSMLKHAGKTQRDAAAFLAVTPATVHSNFSQGRLDFERLCKLAEWCGCSVEMSVTFGNQQIIKTDNHIIKDDGELTISRKAVYNPESKKLE